VRPPRDWGMGDGAAPTSSSASPTSGHSARPVAATTGKAGSWEGGDGRWLEWSVVLSDKALKKRECVSE
jgi:hypothetical protein